MATEVADRGGWHRERAASEERRPGAEGAHLALLWLEEQHAMASQVAAARIYFEGLSDEEVAALVGIPGDLFMMIDCNGKELMLAEG